MPPSFPVFCLGRPPQLTGQRRAGPSPPAQGRPVGTTDGPGLGRKDVETIVDAALDRHLAPLRRALAARNETEPTLRDIVGGLGWIMGLVGIGLYFSRRRP